jgi:hypothetical protein
LKASFLQQRRYLRKTVLFVKAGDLTDLAERVCV